MFERKGKCFFSTSSWQFSVLKTWNHLTLLEDVPGPETLSYTVSRHTLSDGVMMERSVSNKMD